MSTIQIKVISDVTCNNLFKNLKINSDVRIDFDFAPIDQFATEIINHGGEDFLLIHLTQNAFNTYSINEDYLNNLKEILLIIKESISSSNKKVILNTIFFDRLSSSQENLVYQNNLIYNANKLITDFAQNNKSSTILIDIESVISNLGFSDNFSLRNYGVMRFPYSKSLSRAVRGEYEYHLESYFKPRKKVIFVDADNTLWGGIIGEDGINNVKIGHEYPGSVFYHFQQTLLRLKNEGILLSLVTKNNLSDIEEFFATIKMPLTMNDFSEVRANWQPKSSNISEILESLNLASSSAIFIDDNQFEIEEVERVHPDLLCIPFDKNNFNSLNTRLHKKVGLYTHLLTKEDRVKSESYEQEKKRKELKVESKSIEDYLLSLNIKINVHLNDKSFAPRVSQLTQKTNQFNLTTRRYSVSDIEKFMSKDSVFIFDVNDRFGDMGVVGVIIIVNDLIDTFLLSCRAFGRNIEKKMLLSALQHMDQYPMRAEFIATKKNEITKNFYLENGFSLDKQEECIIAYSLKEFHNVDVNLKNVKWI